MKTIFTANAPTPAGHYSQATLVNGMLFIAGQLPIDPATGKRINGTLDDEIHCVLNNFRAILEAAGGNLKQVAKVTVYVTNIADWPQVNKVYAEFFGDHKPARAVVPCGALHYDSRLEIEGVAYLG